MLARLVQFRCRRRRVKVRAPLVEEVYIESDPVVADERVGVEAVDKLECSLYELTLVLDPVVSAREYLVSIRRRRVGVVLADADRDGFPVVGIVVRRLDIERHDRVVVTVVAIVLHAIRRIPRRYVNVW